MRCEDLRLGGDVERGGGFVGDEGFGFEGEGHGDHGALALAAGEFVRVGGEGGGRVGDADLFEEGEGAAGDLGAREVGVDAEDFGDLVADGRSGLSAVIGSWKIIATRAPRSLRIAGSGRARTSSPPRRILAGGDGHAVGQQAHDGAGGHGFAGPAFADDAEGAAALPG